MNATQIISEEMSLDEKLAAIDAAMASAVANAAQTSGSSSQTNVAIDPADAFMCVGCQ